ncbi:MAG: hypothetical protein EBT79_10570 [Actinobacteria bacterium]|nr:hypothetical protein [Actinomycetota bacterium]
MLYQVYETQRTLMEPFVDFAQAAAKLFSNPHSPAGARARLHEHRQLGEIESFDTDGTMRGDHGLALSQ